MTEQKFGNKERQLQFLYGMIKTKYYYDNTFEQFKTEFAKDKIKFLKGKIKDLQKKKGMLHHYYEGGTAQIELQEEKIEEEIEKIYEEITNIERSL